MNHLGALAFIAGLALTTSACSGSDEPADSPASADATTSTSSAPVTSAAASDESSPTVDADDPFCVIAADSIEVSDQIVDKTAGMADLLSTALASGDVSTVNAWGSELADLDAQVLDLYAAGGVYVEGEPVEDSWTTMESFISTYSLELARLAATTPDTASFTSAMAELTTREGVSDLLTQAPAAAEDISPLRQGSLRSGRVTLGGPPRLARMCEPRRTGSAQFRGCERVTPWPSCTSAMER